MLNKNTNILYMTGTRADYGLMRHSLLTINELCNLMLVVTGMHLDRKFGYTIDEIKKDNLKIAKIVQLPCKTDHPKDLSGNLGYLQMQLNYLIAKRKFDYVLIEGDRIEALALAITANCHNIPVIHQGGGDISGSIDNNIRNAITSFSDYHLTGNINSKERLKSMAIDKKKIFMFGEPGLDDVVSKLFLPPYKIFEKYAIDTSKPLVLAIQHPDTKEKISIKQQVQPLLRAITELKIPVIMIYPNNDPGGVKMIGEINKYNLSFLKVFPSLPRVDFLGLMNVCDLIVGNSSSGLVETTLFNLPFINIGGRQKDRIADANTINCINNKDEIINKVKANLNKKGTFKIRHVYGYGHFTKKFVNFLRKI